MRVAWRKNIVAITVISRTYPTKEWATISERFRGDNTDEPAEVFEFAPDFVLTFPRDLTFKRLRWKEVAP